MVGAGGHRADPGVLLVVGVPQRLVRVISDCPEKEVPHSIDSRMDQG